MRDDDEIACDVGERGDAALSGRRSPRSLEPDHDVVVTVAEEPVSGVDVGLALLVAVVDGPISGTITLTRGAVNRLAGLTQPLVDVLVLHPPLVPSRLQPGSALARLSRRKDRERAALLFQLNTLLGTWPRACPTSWYGDWTWTHS